VRMLGQEVSGLVEGDLAVRFVAEHAVDGKENWGITRAW
jgi:hypothetical protein